MISAAKDRTADALTPAAQKESCVNSSPSQEKVPGPLAAIYIRQSRTEEDAGTHNISPEMQEHACRKLLDGYEICVFTDLNRSGKETSKRPAYLDMLRLVDEGAITKVVAYELSRITRDVGDQADFFKRLAAMGVVFVSAREQLDMSTPEGELVGVMLGGTNQFQRKQIQHGYATPSSASANAETASVGSCLDWSGPRSATRRAVARQASTGIRHTPRQSVSSSLNTRRGRTRSAVWLAR
jgi:resolvase-like protein